jgi:hypothetical protein
MEREASGRFFASRHKEWSMAAGVTPTIFVELTPISTAGAVLNLRTGWYEMTHATYGAIQFSPALGVVKFLGLAPAVTDRVRLSYVPYLMRITTNLAADSGPAAFVESYRYLDGAGAPQPAGFVPRLWVFWQRAMGPRMGAQVYFKSYRQFTSGGLSGWAEELRAEPGYETVDVAESQVPIEGTVNEADIAAIKDPRTSQVWLFWTSSRTPVLSTADIFSAGRVIPNSDIYYETINPPMPP